MKKLAGLFIFFLSLLSGCTYNPFLTNNRTTGSATGAGVGAAAGAGTMALLGSSKPFIALGGLGGGALGYYVTTLRYDSGGIIQGGGQVYSVGDIVGIYLPTDQLFEPNTADFTPQAKPVLNSAATVLARYPNNSILISGNTSGFGRAKWEQRLSEARARKVAAYLWDQGIGTNRFKDQSITLNPRKLNYVGYGDYFPIANHYKNESIRQNSRIQITSYPPDCALKLNKKELMGQNVGSLDDPDYSASEQCGSDC